MNYPACLSTLLCAIVVCISCSSPPKIADTKVRHGDVEVRPGRVVLFEPACRGAADVCDAEFRSALVGRLSSDLELAGFTVVFGEQLLASTRERVEAGGDTSGFGPLGVFFAQAGGSIERSVRYEDLPPAGQRALLDEARADGIISLNILVGEDRYGDAFYDQHVFELTARHSVGEDQELGWVVRCSEAGENMNDLAYGIGVTYAQAAEGLGSCVAERVL